MFTAIVILFVLVVILALGVIALISDSVDSEVRLERVESHAVWVGDLRDLREHVSERFRLEGEQANRNFKEQMDCIHLLAAKLGVQFVKESVPDPAAPKVRKITLAKIKVAKAKGGR